MTSQTFFVRLFWIAIGLFTFSAGLEPAIAQRTTKSSKSEQKNGFLETKRKREAARVKEFKDKEFAEMLAARKADPNNSKVFLRVAQFIYKPDQFHQLTQQIKQNPKLAKPYMQRAKFSCDRRCELAPSLEDRKRERKRLINRNIRQKYGNLYLTTEEYEKRFWSEFEADTPLEQVSERNQRIADEFFSEDSIRSDYHMAIQNGINSVEIYLLWSRLKYFKFLSEDAPQPFVSAGTFTAAGLRQLGPEKSYSSEFYYPYTGQPKNYFELALKIDPNRVDALVGLSRVCRYRNNVLELKPTIEKAFKLAPNRSDVREAKAHYHWIHGDFAKARAEFAEAYRLKRKEPHAEADQRRYSPSEKYLALERLARQGELWEEAVDLYTAELKRTKGLKRRRGDINGYHRFEVTARRAECLFALGRDDELKGTKYGREVDHPKHKYYQAQNGLLSPDEALKVALEHLDEDFEDFCEDPLEIVERIVAQNPQHALARLELAKLYFAKRKFNLGKDTESHERNWQPSDSNRYLGEHVYTAARIKSETVQAVKLGAKLADVADLEHDYLYWKFNREKRYNADIRPDDFLPEKHLKDLLESLQLVTAEHFRDFSETLKLAQSLNKAEVARDVANKWGSTNPNDRAGRLQLCWFWLDNGDYKTAHKHLAEGLKHAKAESQEMIERVVAETNGFEARITGKVKRKSYRAKVSEAMLPRLERQFEVLSRAVSEPNDAVGLAKRANVLAILGKNREAIADYTRVIELAPESVLAHCWRAARYMAVGDWDAANADVDAALKLHPESSEAYACRGAILQAQYQFDEAIVAYDQAIKLGTRRREAYVRRAMIHYFRGDLEKTWDDLATSLLILPPERSLLLPMRLPPISKGGPKPTQPAASILPDNENREAVSAALQRFVRGDIRGARETLSDSDLQGQDRFPLAMTFAVQDPDQGLFVYRDYSFDVNSVLFGYDRATEVFPDGKFRDLFAIRVLFQKGKESWNTSKIIERSAHRLIPARSQYRHESNLYQRSPNPDDDFRYNSSLKARYIGAIQRAMHVSSFQDACLSADGLVRFAVATRAPHPRMRVKKATFRVDSDRRKWLVDLAVKTLQDAATAPMRNYPDPLLVTENDLNDLDLDWLKKTIKEQSQTGNVDDLIGAVRARIKRPNAPIIAVKRPPVDGSIPMATANVPKHLTKTIIGTITRVRRHWDRNELDAAQKELKQLGPECDPWPEVHYHRAFTAASLNDFSTAIQEYEKACIAASAKDRPPYLVKNWIVPLSELHTRHAIMIGRTGDLDAALVEMDKALKLEPGNWKLNYQRGLFLDQLGRIDKAKTYFNRSIKLQGEPRLLNHPALPFLKFYEDRDAKTLPALRKHLGAAARLLTNQKYDAAFAEFAAASELVPNDFQTKLRYVLELVKYRRYAESIAPATKAIELARKQGNAKQISSSLMLRGLAYVALEKEAEAEADLARAIKLDPKLAGPVEKTRQAMLKELEAKQIESSRLHLAAGIKLLQTAKYSEGLVELNKGLKIAPNYEELLLFQGSAHFHLHDFAAALESLTKAIAAAKKRADDRTDYVVSESFAARGLVHLAMGNKVAAESDFAAGIKIVPDLAKRIEQTKKIAIKMREKIAETKKAEQAMAKDREEQIAKFQDIAGRDGIIEPPEAVLAFNPKMLLVGDMDNDGHLNQKEWLAVRPLEAQRDRAKIDLGKWLSETFHKYQKGQGDFTYDYKLTREEAPELVKALAPTFDEDQDGAISLTELRKYRLHSVAAAKHFKTAKSLIGKVEWKKIVFELKKSVDPLSEDPELYLWLGVVDHRAGKHREAILYLDQAIQFAKKRGSKLWLTVSLTLKGDALSSMQKYEQAEVQYAEAIKVDPKQATKKSFQDRRNANAKKLKDLDRGKEK